jgi:hypothetical protein
VQPHFGQVLKKIFLGPEDTSDTLPPQGYRRTKELIQEEWNNPTFGIMRLVRLFLMAISCFSPILVIDQVVGSTRPSVIALSRELYYFARAVLLAIVVFSQGYKSSLLVALVIYFVYDILSHLAGATFVWGKYSIDPRRSLLLALVNYFELTLAFAVFYLHWNCLVWRGGRSATEALYFSIVTATTAGFGDVLPSVVPGERIVIAQLSIFLLFAVLFVSTFLSRVPMEVRSTSKRNDPAA